MSGDDTEGGEEEGAGLGDRLLGARARLPTSKLGRLGRLASVGLQSGKMALGRRLGGAQELPIDPQTLARLVESIGQLKGLAMKSAQIMSYIDVALPEDVRQALAVLQTHAQPMDFEEVRAIVAEALPRDRAAELLATMEPAPVAAASIGQVHRARLPDGQAVAVKVQYRGIDQAIEADFGASRLGTTMASMIFPGSSVEGFVEEAKSRFLEECDYEREAAMQDRFASLFADHPVIQVPRVHHPWCGRRVLTTSFVEGGLGLERWLAGDPPQQVRDRLGRALFEFYIGALFRHGLYNCDPHPGNVLILDDGHRAAMLDFGCVRAFEPELVATLAELSRAVARDDEAALRQVFRRLGMIQAGQRGEEDYPFALARRMVRSFYGSMLRDEVTAVDLQDAWSLREITAGKREMMQLNLPGEFLFLFRIRFGLMAVLSRIGARANWYRLERGFLEEAPPSK